MSARDPGGVMVTGADTPFKSAVIAALRSTRGSDHVVGAGGSSSAPVDLSSRRAVHDLLFGEHARGVETIIHAPLQLQPAGGRCDRDVQATRELLAAAEEAPGIRSFVLCSSSAVYRLARDAPRLIGENEPLDLASRFSRNRSLVEQDVTACTRVGSGRLRIVVLRNAEILAPDCGGQLHDYLSSRVCLRPLGYDPMVNVLSLSDAAHAATLAAVSSSAGVFNIPGRDTLPLSELIHRTGRLGLPLPGPLLAPLYHARSTVTGGRFRYALDELRFHYGAILDGSRAEQVLGYVAQCPVPLTTLFGPLHLAACTTPTGEQP
jgi:UDP-glucose 4-epimerase